MAEKQFGILQTEVKAADDESRTLSFLGTTAVRDRMGDEIPLKGWDFDNYKKNPIVLWNHNYNELPIGRTEAIRKKTIDGVQGWHFSVKFAPAAANPKAEQIYQLAKQGFLSAVSVGFQSHESAWIDEDEEEKKSNRKPDIKPGKVFLKKELLELSLVPVPANPEALLTARQRGLEVPTELSRALDMWQTERALEALENTKQIKEQLRDLDDNAFEYEDEDLDIQIGKLDAEAVGIVDPFEISKSNVEDVIETKPGWDDDPATKEIKYRVRDPGLFQEGSFKRVVLQKTVPRVIGVLGKLKGEDTMTVQSLRFPREDGWTLAKAKEWLKAHPKVRSIFDVLYDIDYFVEIWENLSKDYDPENEFRKRLEQTLASDIAEPADGTAETLEEEDVATDPSTSALSDPQLIPAPTSEAGGPEHITSKFLVLKRKPQRILRIRKA